MTFTASSMYKSKEAGHLVTVSTDKTAKDQTVFFDYFPVKGIVDMRIEHHIGKPVEVTIRMYVAGVNYVSPEEEK